uniref:DUF3899 domain-containing protein n=1 Tax=Flavobacterium subsaxonicum TaxID=426226 RepID=UPI0037435195
MWRVAHVYLLVYLVKAGFFNTVGYLFNRFGNVAGKEISNYNRDKQHERVHLHKADKKVAELFLIIAIIFYIR